MKPRAAARLAWSLWGVAVFGGAVAVALLVWNRALDAPGSFGPPGFVAAFAFIFGSVGALVASRRPENPIGWILLGVGVLSAIQEIGQQYAVRGLLVDPGSLPGADWGAWSGEWIWIPITGSLLIFLLLLFPSGRLPSPRWRWVALLGFAGMAVATAGGALQPRLEGFGQIPTPLPVATGAAEGILSAGMTAYLAAAVSSVVSLVVRYRRSRGEERAQMKWIATAGVFAVVAMGVTFPANLLRIYADATAVLVLLGVGALPVAAGIAILKYRLYDIDVVINRAVVYGLLAAFVTALYIGIVVGIGAALGRRGGLLLPGVAAAVVALVFHPARLRAQRFANRLVYGKRATPYEVLSEFSDRLAGAYSVEDVLPRMARIAGEGTGAARAAVWLHVGRELRRSISWPDGDPTAVQATGEVLPELPDADRALPVRHQGELLGALTVAKPRGETLSPSEEKLLSDLAAQAGLVLRNVRLTEELRANLDELRASRQRIVAAQDTERRRLERNIHDGAQQQLVALAVKLRLIETLGPKDPARAGEMARQAKAEAQDALENLRDLARGIYPPALADRGLTAALEAQARKVPLPVAIEADGVGRYPQEVEAAAYFCVLEALQNVSKYAGASRAVVRLAERGGRLAFEVEDDGGGFDPAVTPRGAGLQNMVDRLEALGGSLEVRSAPGAGTTVMASVPVQPEAAAQASVRRSGSNSDLGI
ncbi:MAG: histidine kinase [Actinomycetota bacterium]